MAAPAGRPRRLRRAIAAVAQADRLELLRAGDRGDAPASQSGKVPDRELRAALVVRQQAEGLGVLDAAEHVDDRQARRRGLDRFAPVDAARGHDEAVDPLAEQLIDVPPLARRIVGGVAHEDRDALIEQPPLDRRDDRKAEPAETVGRDDARPSSTARDAGSARGRSAGSRSLSRHWRSVRARFLAQGCHCC